jgi:hypothetical protein
LFLKLKSNPLTLRQQGRYFVFGFHESLIKQKVAHSEIIQNVMVTDFLCKLETEMKPSIEKKIFDCFCQLIIFKHTPHKNIKKTLQ